MTLLPRPCLCLVTDRRRTAPEARTLQAELQALGNLIDDAVGAGIDLIQIREPDLDAAQLAAFVRAVVTRTPAATRILVNDRADVALATGAGGVHLRGDGPPSSRVRAFGPAGWLVGRSIHTADEAAASAGSDYTIFGTVFASTSKPGVAPTGADGLAAAVGACASPVLAIGGITPARAPACKRAGAAGVAAIGAFLPIGRTPDALGAAAAVRALRLAWAGR